MAGRRQRGKGQGTLFKRKQGGAWHMQWWDHDGKRREKSTGTTDKRTAERILAERVKHTALKRQGVVDPTENRLAQEARKPLADHIAEYVRHSERSDQARESVEAKRRHLQRVVDAGASRLKDLTPEVIEDAMEALRNEGRSCRTANHLRDLAAGFASWCVKTGRLASNRIRNVPRLDERNDRRRVRRPLSEAELAALLKVGEERGRKLWYMMAALAGLRKGDLQRIQWKNIDFEEKTISIPDGKAKRTDVIPLHTQLAAELKSEHEKRRPHPNTKVFPHSVNNETQRKDFYRAGLARKEAVTDEAGNPVKTGKGRRRQQKFRYVCEDDQGRVIDLHALRTTLGTNLARCGVPPQLAQKIMRHSDYRTTQQHYTVLGLDDTSRAMEKVPGVNTPEGKSGADGAEAEDADRTGANPLQQLCQQFEHETTQSDAIKRDPDAEPLIQLGQPKPGNDPSLREKMQDGAKECEKRPLRDSNPRFQNENLAS